MSGGGDTATVLRSGVAPLDERLGGLTPGKPHLITGTPGSGKTALCLTFVREGLSAGGSAAVLTEDEPHDLVAQATDLGIDLRRAAAAGRFAMIRYQRGFAARFGRALSPASAFDELSRLIGADTPDRFVVDSITPFLDGDAASGAGVGALADFLERARATTLVTCPGDLRDYYDRRLDPLVRRCAAVVHLSAYGQGIGRMDVVKARRRLWSDSPTFFAVRSGRGVIPLEDDTGERGRAGAFRRQILLFEGDDGLPPDLRAALESGFVVSPQGRPTAAVPEVFRFDVGAVVVAAYWDTLPDAGLFLQQLRHLGNRTPVVLITCGAVRSVDRARALLAGFDDVVADTSGPAELIARVAAVIRRGRSTTVPVAAPDGPTPDGHAAEGGSTLLDEGRFRDTIETALTDGNSGRVFSVLLLNPEAGELEALASVVSRMMRGGSGDVASVVGDRVAVYMPGTRRTDVTPLLRRVTEAWRRAGRSELRAVQLAYPIDSERLRADLRLPASPVQGPTIE